VAIDTGSPEWRAVLGFIDLRLELLQAELEDLSIHPRTADQIRGRIAELYELRRLPEDVPQRFPNPGRFEGGMDGEF
jgi:hypothetical protein